jgi:CBS domain-containing protein
VIPRIESECTAEEAYSWSEGLAIFASGSPFPPVAYKGRTYVPGQGNNAYILPGVGLGVIASEATRVTDEMFFVAAKTAADLVTENDRSQGRIYPGLTRIREVSAVIATAVADVAFRRGLTTMTRPAGLAGHVEAQMYEPTYGQYVWQRKRTAGGKAMIVAKRMVRNPVFVDENDSMKKAIDLLKERGIRHLPVLKDGEKLVGILTERDIKQASPSQATALEIREIYYLMDQVKVKQIMSRRPYTISPTAPIEEAALIMRDKKIGCLPVIEEGRLVGILTETDILDSFLDSMGVSGPGYRMELALPNRPGMLFEVLKLMKDFDANIVSVATVAHDEPDKKVLVFRIEVKNYKVMKAAIKKAGYEMLSAD